jgi:GT2 family glycosyltransferase
MKKIINKKPFLTIGYATYNRKKLINRRLREILLMNLRKDIEVIIVDNASIDGTFSELKKIKSPKNISIYCNKTNLGFGGNVIKVIKKAKT